MNIRLPSTSDVHSDSTSIFSAPSSFLTAILFLERDSDNLCGLDE